MSARILTSAQLGAISPTLAAVLRDRQLTADRAAAADRLEAMRPRTRIERAMVSQLTNHARLSLLCLGQVPDMTGFPRTTIAACDADVVLEMPAVTL